MFNLLMVGRNKVNLVGRVPEINLKNLVSRLRI